MECSNRAKWEHLYENHSIDHSWEDYSTYVSNDHPINGMVSFKVRIRPHNIKHSPRDEPT